MCKPISFVKGLNKKKLKFKLHASQLYMSSSIAQNGPNISKTLFFPSSVKMLLTKLPIRFPQKIIKNIVAEMKSKPSRSQEHRLSL